MEDKIHQSISWLESNLSVANVHGKNILKKLKDNKINSQTVDSDLLQIFNLYKTWYRKNNEITSYSKEDIYKKVDLLNKYKKDTDMFQFSAQSKFHSSIIEEFLYFLFKDLVSSKNTELSNSIDKKLIIGGTRAYTNLFFAPYDLHSFLNNLQIKINVKDQDFAIYREIRLKVDGEEVIITVPVVSIECKTYIDKTMLEGSIATAEKIKNGNPYSLFIILTEYYDVSFDVDPAYSRIDQIYVLRKQKRKSKNTNDISPDVIYDFFLYVKKHLESKWSNIKEKLENEGKIL